MAHIPLVMTDDQHRRLRAVAKHFRMTMVAVLRDAMVKELREREREIAEDEAKKKANKGKPRIPEAPTVTAEPVLSIPTPRAQAKPQDPVPLSDGVAIIGDLGEDEGDE